MGNRGSNSEKLAEDRTDLAEDRTVMATERTFAGWMRTAFAAIGIGIGFRALFGEFSPPYAARIIATVFILMGAMLAIWAERRACATFRRLNAHKASSPDLPRLRWIAWSIATGATVLAIGLWLMKDPAGG